MSEYNLRRQEYRIKHIVPLAIHGECVVVHLNRGMYALVDVADYPKVAPYRWSVKAHGQTFYARTDLPVANGKRRTLYMHVLLFGKAPPGFENDHELGNGLDNRRAGIRIATVCQNRQNSRKRKSTSSRFKGVSWSAELNKWRAYIDGKHLGYFADEFDAAAAYDHAAKTQFAEFSKLNLQFQGSGARGQ